MRRSLAKFSESEVSNHTPSWADFTTTTPELKFSVHTGPYPCIARNLSAVLVWNIVIRQLDPTHQLIVSFVGGAKEIGIFKRQYAVAHHALMIGDQFVGSVEAGA